jgi:DNA topoisomerase-3
MEREGNHLLPTSRGTQVVSLAPKILSSPELTAQWELRLEKISHGKENPEAFLSDIRKNTAQLVQSVKADSTKFQEEPPDPEAYSERRMTRKERAQQKYLVRKYSDQQDIKTNLGDLLKKALDKKDSQ